MNILTENDARDQQESEVVCMMKKSRDEKGRLADTETSRLISHKTVSSLKSMNKNCNPQNDGNTVSILNQTTSFLKNNQKCLLMTIFLMTVGLLFMITPFHKFVINYINSNIHKLRKQSIERPIISDFVIFWLNVAGSFILPSQAHIFVLTAFIIKEFIRAFFQNLISAIFALIFGYYVANACFYQKFYESYKDDIKFITMEEFVKEIPWLFSFFLWFSLIPTPLKLLIFPLTQITFWQFFLPGILVLTSNILICTLIGVTFEELMTLDSFYWGSMPILIKIEQTFTLIETILTIVTIFLYSKKFKERIDKIYKERQDLLSNAETDDENNEVCPKENKDSYANCYR